MDELTQWAGRFRAEAPAVEHWSLRLLHEQSERLHVRQGVLQPVTDQLQRGAMVTLLFEGGVGYAATSDFSPSGVRRCFQQAMQWARRTKGHLLFPADAGAVRIGQHSYHSPVEQAWSQASLSDKLNLLQDINQTLAVDERIVDWSAGLGWRIVHQLLTDADGGELMQEFSFLYPSMTAVANSGDKTQVRTFGMDGACQGGLEQLQQLEFAGQAPRVAEEALQLLDAPECPDGIMDLLLLPNQMVLQIHESIGHPLELDRILGDERNYAGTSFVNLDMFGSYQYGSELLNVTFDPGIRQQLASYAYDDEGTAAERNYIIRNGVLERPLGGAVSQARAGIDGVANARASAWNRPPIDRMANLNVEPGNTGFDELVAGIGKGILMDTNCSWSIDDSRNKFQFGCELGRIIEDGELKGLVRTPNYRGISATFWRNLSAVGDADTFRVMGTPNCGKGEPNQVIGTGHASPACVFRDVEIFGGDA